MGLLIGIVVFVICWVYAVTEFGFFLGVGLGWIPSLFIAWICVLGATLVEGAIVQAKLTKERNKHFSASLASLENKSAKPNQPISDKTNKLVNLIWVAVFVLMGLAIMYA